MSSAKPARSVPKLRLGPLTRADTADALCLWGDYETVRYTNWTYTPNLDEAAERMDRVLGRYGKEPRHFGPFVVRLTNGWFVGLMGAELCPETERDYEVWYILRREAWGMGIGHVALGELMRHLRDSGRVRKAVATTVTANVASWTILERHGFVRERVIHGGHKVHGEGLGLFVYGQVIEVPCGHATAHFLGGITQRNPFTDTAAVPESA